jgi:hypothetical protein
MPSLIVTRFGHLCSSSTESQLLYERSEHRDEQKDAQLLDRTTPQIWIPSDERFLAQRSEEMHEFMFRPNAALVEGP